VLSVFRAEGLDAHGLPWTPMDRYGQLVEAAGVERQYSKQLASNDLRMFAAEIRTPRCTPTLGLILFARTCSPEMA